MTASDFAARRFQSAASHYIAGRPPYPPALITRVASRLRLTPSHRLLDIGCGPANLTLSFAPYVGEILAIDPEPAMLALARTATAHVANVRIEHAAAADISPHFGRFRAALIGRAFHWLDRDDTLRRLDAVLDHEGAVVVFDDEQPKIPQNDWLREYREIVERYADDDEDRSRRKSDAFTPHLSILLGSAFSQIETIGVIVSHGVAPETLIDRALSQSSTSQARLGPRTAAMVTDLRAAIAAWSGTPRVEIVEWTAMVARRPSSAFPRQVQSDGIIQSAGEQPTDD